MVRDRYIFKKAARPRLQLVVSAKKKATFAGFPSQANLHISGLNKPVDAPVVEASVNAPVVEASVNAPVVEAPVNAPVVFLDVPSQKATSTIVMHDRNVTVKASHVFANTVASTFGRLKPPQRPNEPKTQPQSKRQSISIKRRSKPRKKGRIHDDEEAEGPSENIAQTDEEEEDEEDMNGDDCAFIDDTEHPGEDDSDSFDSH